MYVYIFNRLVGAAVTVFLVLTLVFFLVRLSGDPVALMADPYFDEDDIQALREDLGLDGTVAEQYLVFLGNVVRGDFGNSIRFREPALNLYLDRMPATLKLMVFGVFFAIGLGIPIGVIAGVSPGSRIDGVARTGALLGQAVPSFWLGIMLILLFAVQLGWLPTSGEHGLKSMILPGITLGSFSIAAMTRLTRSTVLDIWDTEYVRLLMVKGLPRRLVIWKHVVKNAALPVMTLASLQMIAFLSGSVIVEQIFAWPGVGRVAVEAVFSRDFPLIQTVVVINTVLLVLMNLAVDLAYVAIDPRIRFTAAR